MPGEVQCLKGMAKYDEVVNSGNAVMIHFMAAYNNQCQLVGPVFKSMAERYPGMECYYVDVDADQAIADKAGVRAMPYFVAFKDGKKVDEFSLGANRTKLQQLCEKIA
ncbi:thioredoxin [Penicillium pulvis]|uniref:thioredoxin n=1 Tax=Penicillium pulvis TaxID=1562058 RepID=UPI0025471BF1|nr:thioredoxin [Penicillium pulvis]KAJ5806307.1 thioredoxin [Penicillium pulvis]